MVRDEDTDEVLIRRFQRGDREAFNAFVCRHQDRIYRLCSQSLKTGVDPADACQEVFLRGYTGLGRFRFGAKPFTWLYRTAKNVCRELNRKVKELPGQAIEIAQPSMVEKQLSDLDTVKLVRRLVKGLPERQQDVVLLRIFEGMSVEETAQAMGVRPGTVKAHLHKAIRALRSTVEAMDIEGKDYD